MYILQEMFSFFFNLLIFFFWLLWIFVAVRGLSPVAESGGFSLVAVWGLLSSCGMWASHCSGSSCLGTRALEYGLSSCGTQTLLPHGMWNLPGPGIEPMSPTLAGRFLTTGPAGKSAMLVLRNLLTQLRWTGKSKICKAGQYTENSGRISVVVLRQNSSGKFSFCS